LAQRMKIYVPIVKYSSMLVTVEAGGVER